MHRILALAALVMLVGHAFADSPKPVRPKFKARARCTRVVAKDVAASDLSVVSIVAQGTTRKLLLMDASKLGYILHPTECAGRERVPFANWSALPARHP